MNNVIVNVIYHYRAAAVFAVSRLSFGIKEI